MTESIEELQAILDGAPEGAVSVTTGTSKYINKNGSPYNNITKTFSIGMQFCGETRSLSDIKRIAELMESNNEQNN